MSDDDDTDPDRRSPIPRPGEQGWSSTGWPDSAGQSPHDRAAPPTPPEWVAPSRPGVDDWADPDWSSPAVPSVPPEAAAPAVPAPPTPPSGAERLSQFTDPAGPGPERPSPRIADPVGPGPERPSPRIAVDRVLPPPVVRSTTPASGVQPTVIPIATDSTTGAAGIEPTGRVIGSDGTSPPASADPTTQYRRPAPRSSPEPPVGGDTAGAGAANQRFGTDHRFEGPSPRSSPPPLTPPHKQSDKPPGDQPIRERLESVAEKVTVAAGVERLEDGFSLRHLFGNSFRRRSQVDVEAELMVGTRTTTPPLSAVRAEWPQPWLFARTLLASGAVFLLFFVGWTVFRAITLLPGLIIVGSFAMPVAVLIFFFEINLPRNVSIVAVLRMVFLGGTASLLFSLLGFELFDFPWLGAMVAGLIEEPAKLLAVVLVARQAHHRFILNGLLFGAAIGAGFAAFESAGYALVAALFALDNGDVIDNIVLRGLLSPFGHVVWTAITAGALWRVKGADQLRLEHLKDPRFWRVMVLAILLHTTWNSPVPALLYLKFVLLGAIAWLVCFSLLQEGIGQVRTEQRKLIE